MCGLVATSPAAAPVTLAEDLTQAIHKTMELGSKARYWRSSRLKAIQAECCQTEYWANEALDRKRSETSKRVAPNVNLARNRIRSESDRLA